MIVYYTGTGNSRYVAQRFAAALGDDLITANEYIKNDTPADAALRPAVGVRLADLRLADPAHLSPTFCAAAASPAAGRLTLS